MTAQGFLRDQLSVLVEQGWEVHLACSADDGTDSFQRLQELEGVTFHQLPMDRRPNLPRDAISFWRWLRLLNYVRPDIVVSSTPKAGLLGTVASWIGGVPVRIYHIRGLRAEGLRGAMAVTSKMSERIATAASTHVLLDSSSLMKSMHQRHLLAREKGEVLGAGSSCGVDSQLFRPPTSTERQVARQSLGLTSEDFVVGFLGRLTIDKGIRELIDVSIALHEDDPRIKLVLVGPLEDAARLDRHLTLIKSQAWATLADRTRNPREIYWALDVFCLPSYREGFPITALEAQACGLPVITTTATGCIDSIQPNVTGYCVPPADRAALATAVRNLANSPISQHIMGTAARTWVTSKFDRRTVNQRFIAYLNVVLKPSR